MTEDTGELRPAPPGYLDLLYGVLFRPKETFAAAAAAPPVGGALTLVATVSLLEGLLRGAGPGAVLRGSLGLFLTVLGLALAAAGLGLVAELLGGRGRAATLFALLGLARAPELIAVPLTVLGRAWPPVATAGSLVTGLWSLALIILALRWGYGISAGQATAVLLLGAGLLLAVPLVALVLGILVLLSDPAVLEAFRL